MAIQISISNAIGAIDVIGSSVDPDAQAFITAAGITDPTQQSAINTLVVSLKGYNIWTKFKAIYPIVGGSAATHKWNLKDPRDLDVAFRLAFATGWTHSATGMTPNGATYADTFFNGATQLITAPSHISSYLRNTQTNNNIPIGASDAFFGLWQMNTINNSGFYYYHGSVASEVLTTITTEVGLFLSSTVSATSRKNYINGVLKTTRTTNLSIAYPAFNLYLGARNSAGTASTFSTKQCAFASIGDGLTDTEAANFYTAVQAFQTTLGRSIGTQTVSDPDAQAFVTAAAIDDQVQANAINDLVIGMKADGIWTKMKAIYPVVGGVASSHAVNLKTPGTFNLTFASGWSHSVNGMTPSVTYANTGFNPLTQSLPRNSASMGVYNRTNTVIGGGHGQRVSNNFEMFDPWSDNRVYAYINNGASGYNVAVPNSLGLFQASRTTSTAIAISQNNTINNSSFATTGDSNGNLWIGASNNGGTGTFFNNRQIAFFYIAEGFDNTEMQNIYTRVQAFQTTLNRQV